MALGPGFLLIIIADNKPVRNFRLIAYWCYVSLAVIVVLALAMHVHRSVIEASRVVV
jgi:hypothetical protein